MTTNTTRARVWWAAFLLAVLFHAAVILLASLGRLFASHAEIRAHPQPIELVFAAAQAAPPGPADEPSFFSELPPDRADESPDRPEFLSNVNSQARDLIPGGEETLSRLSGLSEAPHVRIDPGADASARMDGMIRPEPAKDASADSPHESASTHRDRQPEPVVTGPGARPATVDPPEDLTDRPALSPQETSSATSPRLLDPRVPVPPSPRSPLDPSLRPGTDFHQVEMHRPGGNAALSGVVSLNTVAWAWAPWLQEFSRNLERRWLAPVAYYMGIVDGWTEIELEVARDGALKRLVVLEANGHDSLRQTSVAVLEAMAPYRSLPEDFPEKSLILRIKLVYPSLRSRGR